MVIFGLFAVFGDVISQAAQAFLPATVSLSGLLPPKRLLVSYWIRLLSTMNWDTFTITFQHFCMAWAAQLWVIWTKFEFLVISQVSGASMDPKPGHVVSDIVLLEGCGRVRGEGCGKLGGWLHICSEQGNEGDKFYKCRLGSPRQQRTWPQNYLQLVQQ